MRRINTYLLYSLGKHLAPLEAINSQEATFGAVLFPLINARSSVQGLLRSEDIPLRTCRQAANNLVTSIDAVVPADISEAFKRDQNTSINWWMIDNVKESAKRFETVLAEELNISDTYAIAQKAAYSTADLVSTGDNVFSKDVRAKLPTRALEDIRQATKCLAFETPTAAAFHTVRAIESVLLAYYEKITGKKPPARMRNWSVYIRLLRESGKADTKIVDFLDHIRNTYRNPVAHPEAVLTVDEMIVLLGVAAGAITQMALAL